MPFSVNGIGTRYYGRREKGRDGSYVTTEWFTVLFIPLLPLGSYRVWSTGGGGWYLLLATTDRIADPVPLNWFQVLSVYGTYLVIGIVWWLGGAFS